MKIIKCFLLCSLFSVASNATISESSLSSAFGPYKQPTAVTQLIKRLQSTFNSENSQFLVEKLKPHANKRFQVSKSDGQTWLLKVNEVEVPIRLKRGKLVVAGLFDLMNSKKSLKPQWNTITNRLRIAIEKRRKTSSLFIERADAIFPYIMVAVATAGLSYLVYEASDCFTMDGYQLRCEEMLSGKNPAPPQEEFYDLITFAIDYEKRFEEKNIIAKCELERIFVRRCLRTAYARRKSLGITDLKQRRRADYLNGPLDNPFDPSDVYTIQQ